MLKYIVCRSIRCYKIVNQRNILIQYCILSIIDIPSKPVYSNDVYTYSLLCIIYPIYTSLYLAGIRSPVRIEKNQKKTKIWLVFNF